MNREGHAFDRPACLRDIQQGIGHLHGLGIIHCDINPMNILSNGSHATKSFVIGDFDSCTMEGQDLGLKAGTKGWTKEDFRVAVREMDWYGFHKIEQFIQPHT